MNKYKSLILIILINCLSSLTKNIYPSSLPMGKLIGLALIINLLIIFFQTLKKIDLLYFLFLIGMYILTFLRISDFSVDLEHIIFFTSTTMIIWKFSELKIREELYKEFLANKGIIIKFCNLSLILVTIALFINSSWIVVNGQRVFFGLCESGHKLAGNLCLIGSLYLISILDEKINIKKLFPFVIIFLIILLSGSRTYLISYAIILAILYIRKLKNIKIIKLLLPFLLIILIYFFLKSSVFARFTIMGQNKYISDNFWEASSSGRLIWWEIDLKDFKEMNLISKLFGNGFTYLYDLNETKYGLRISAHNDFITLLISTGLFGCIGYLCIILRWFFKKNNLNSKSMFIFMILTISLYLFNAMISGVYEAQQYIFCNLFVSLIMISIDKEANSNEIYY